MSAASVAQLPIDWHGEKLDARLRQLGYMKDLAWHPNWELEERFGQRFNSRNGELRGLGYRIESRHLTLERVCELGRAGRGPRGKVKGRANGNEYRLVSGIPGVPPPMKATRVRVYIYEEDARALLKGEVTDLTRSAVVKGLESRTAQQKLAARRGRRG